MSDRRGRKEALQVIPSSTRGRETLVDYAAAPPADAREGVASKAAGSFLLATTKLVFFISFFFFALRIASCARCSEAELQTFGNCFCSVVVREVEECQESPQRMQGLSGQTLSLFSPLLRCTVSLFVSHNLSGDCARCGARASS